MYINHHLKQQQQRLPEVRERECLTNDFDCHRSERESVSLTTFLPPPPPPSPPPPHLRHTYCSAPSPRTTCPEYVAENWTTSCSCVASSGSNDVPANFTWPGHSDTEVLTLQNVTRNSNGTKYTCEGRSDGRLVSSTVYTLKVACEYDFNDANLVASAGIVFRRCCLRFLLLLLLLL